MICKAENVLVRLALSFHLYVFSWSELYSCVMCQAEKGWMTKCSVCWDGSEAMMKYLPPHFTPLTFSPPFTVHSTSSIQVYETPFFVAVDHEKKKVVISIRGTLSPKVNFSFLILSLKYSPPPSKH